MKTVKTKSRVGGHCDEIIVSVPDKDCDVTFVFPNGKEILICIRPCEDDNDPDYLGTISLVLPKEDNVATFGEGGCVSKPVHNKRQHVRKTKQIHIEIPTNQ